MSVGQRTPHKSTPLRAAPYFRPDPVGGSPSRSPLTNSQATSCIRRNDERQMAVFRIVRLPPGEACRYDNNASNKPVTRPLLMACMTIGPISEFRHSRTSENPTARVVSTGIPTIP